MNIKKFIPTVAFSFGLLLTIISFRTFVLPQSRASFSPPEGLSVPYIRLVESGSVGNQVSVDVMVNTGSLETLAADIGIAYDPMVLRMKDEPIDYQLYAVRYITGNQPGSLTASFFSNPDRGEQTLKNVNSEERLMTLEFEIIGSGPTELKLTDDTTLIQVYKERLEKPVNVLQSTGNLTLEF